MPNVGWWADNYYALYFWSIPLFWIFIDYGTPE
jgi:hypothetical protein